jgi:hypothetical protein
MARCHLLSFLKAHRDFEWSEDDGVLEKGRLVLFVEKEEQAIK